MDIKLAGFNIDKSIIDTLPDKTKATPEVISAAYARISRSSKSVSELRTEALEEVTKARKSNQKIIFEMGHSSIAEHAVFNFDIIDVSRYLTEFIQRSRYASFTEKSQRYVKLKNDYVIPQELENNNIKNKYIKLMDSAFELYDNLYKIILLQLEKNSLNKSHRELENTAKEDARYVLPLATKTQMGMTINARSLEQLLKRLSSIDLIEAQKLKQNLMEEVSNIAPSMIRYVDSDDFKSNLNNVPIKIKNKTNNNNDVIALGHNQDLDNIILAALIFEQKGGRISDNITSINKLTKHSIESLWKSVFHGIKPWHKMPRAFELIDFTFEITMSLSCYAQFKRHRACTIIRAPMNTYYGYINFWPDIDKNLVKNIKSYFKECEILAMELKKINPLLTNYVLTNAHNVKVLTKMNLREIYHFVRLRSDLHAQWEIRNISEKIVKIVRDACPYASRYLMGKSEMSRLEN